MSSDRTWAQVLEHWNPVEAALDPQGVVRDLQRAVGEITNLWEQHTMLLEDHEELREEVARLRAGLSLDVIDITAPSTIKETPHHG